MESSVSIRYFYSKPLLQDYNVTAIARQHGMKAATLRKRVRVALSRWPKLPEKEILARALRPPVRPWRPYPPIAASIRVVDAVRAVG